MIDFNWSSDNWRYKTTSESPGDISANDIHGNRATLWHFEVSEAQETLGVFLTPDGNHKAQVDKMIQAAKKWVDVMCTGSISHQKVHLSKISTIWRILLYPLPSLNLTRD